MHRLCVRLAIALLAVAATHAVAQDVPIYTDGLLNGFLNYSYSALPDDGSDFNNAAPFHNSAPSIAFTGDATFNAVSFAHPSATYASGSYFGLRFFVHGGGTGGQQISLMLQTNGGTTPVLPAVVPLDAYIAGGAIPANSWAQVDVPFSVLAFNNDGSFDRIDIQTADGTQPVLYIDDVSLTTTTSGIQNSIFADSFEPELLFVPQYEAHSIKVYRRVTNPAAGVADFAFLRDAPLAVGIKPNALAFSPDGNLWVVDDGAESLLRYTLQAMLNDANPTPDKVIGPVGNGNSIIGMAFFGAYAYVAQTDFGATNRVLKFAVADLAAGNNVSTALTNANLATPAGLAFDAQGRLWITNNGNNTVVRMSNTSTGAVDKIGSNTSVGARNSLNNIEGVAFDQYGSLWVGNNGEPTISAYADWQLNDAAFGATVPVYQLDIAPGVTVPAMGHTGFVGGLAFDRNGNQWSNYEDTYSVLEYALTSFPRGGGMPGVGSYTSTPEPILGNNDVTTDPGFGGIAFWPVPNTLHVR